MPSPRPQRAVRAQPVPERRHVRGRGGRQLRLRLHGGLRRRLLPAEPGGLADSSPQLSRPLIQTLAF